MKGIFLVFGVFLTVLVYGCDERRENIACSRVSSLSDEIRQSRSVFGFDQTCSTYGERFTSAIDTCVEEYYRPCYPELVEAIQDAAGVFHEQCQDQGDGSSDASPSAEQDGVSPDGDCDEDEHDFCVRDTDAWRETVYNATLEHGISHTCRLYAEDYIDDIDRCLRVLGHCDPSLFDEVLHEKQTSIITCSQSFAREEAPTNDGLCDSEDVRDCDATLQAWAQVLSREFENSTQRQVCRKYFLDYLLDLTNCAGIYKDCTQIFVTSHVYELIEDTTNHCTSHLKDSSSRKSSSMVLVMACIYCIAHLFFWKM